MILKKNEFFLLIFLVLLQSCSGGRIGNFFESSFSDVEKISRNEDFQKNLENKKIVVKETKEISNNKNEKISRDENFQKNFENKKDINSEKKPKQKSKIKNFSKNRKIELQSYKIIFILKDVDPKDPTEELSNILSNSEVNFEIEKIERIFDSKSKSMKKIN